MLKTLSIAKAFFKAFFHSHTYTHRLVPQSIPLSDWGQNSAPTYETVSGNYEEIPAAVKVNYAYTQNEAYLTVSGRDNTTPPSGGIYDN